LAAHDIHFSVVIGRVFGSFSAEEKTS